MIKVSSDKTTVYKEPTYHLHLAPQMTSQPPVMKSVALKSAPYQNLDLLVDQVVQQRYGPELQSFSKEKIEKLRKQTVYSLMSRHDQHSSMKIQLPLAQDQGLVQHTKNRLEALIQPHKVDLTELARFVFSDCKEESFSMLLAIKLGSLPGNLEKPQKELLFEEVYKIRQELDTLTSATTQYYRPALSTQGLSYLSHTGETITLTHPIPSSYDRASPDVQNGRMNIDSEGHVIYSTGRIETQHKALQVLHKLVEQTFQSGQISTDRLIQQPDGSYLYPVVVENLLSINPLAKKERELLLNEDAVLKQLSGSNLSVTLPSHEKVTVKLQLLHFSTQANYNVLLGQSHGLSATGSDIAERLSKEGTQSLSDYFQKVKEKLPPYKQEAVKYCLEKLSSSSQLQNRLMYRAFICELLDIPYHVHCKSSKDRTAVVVAIKKALHQWIKMEQWKGEVRLPDPIQFFNSRVFREYSEAALFENLTLTDQGVGISGVFSQKLYTQERGFSFQVSLAEHTFPSLVLSRRHLHAASTLERVFKALLGAVASAILMTLYVALFPFIFAALYFLYQEDCLKAAGYIFLALLTLPIQSGFRPMWIDRNSPVLKERSFLLTKSSKVPFHAPRDPLSPYELNRAIENLAEEPYQRLLQFLKTSDPKKLEVKKGIDNTTGADETAEYLLREIANNYPELAQAKNSPRLQALLQAAQQSSITLFRLFDISPQLMSFAQATDEKYPTDELKANYVREKTKQEGSLVLTDAFNADFHRTHIVVKSVEKETHFKTEQKALRRLGRFFQALKTLPVLREVGNNIPFSIQEMLSQKNTLFTALSRLVQTITESATLGSAESRTLTLEQGNDSQLVLRLSETILVRSPENPQKIMGRISYQCEFYLDKNQDWKPTLHKVSELQFKWEDVSELLSPSAAGNLDSKVGIAKMNNNLALLSKYVDAIQQHEESSSIALDELKSAVDPLLETMKGIKLSQQDLKKSDFTYNFRLNAVAFRDCKEGKEKKMLRNIIIGLFQCIPSEELEQDLRKTHSKNNYNLPSAEEVAATKI